MHPVSGQLHTVDDDVAAILSEAHAHIDVVCDDLIGETSVDGLLSGEPGLGVDHTLDGIFVSTTGLGIDGDGSVVGRPQLLGDLVEVWHLIVAI